VAHDKTPDTHSSIVGGSSAARMLNCAGSYTLLQAIPDSVKNASTSYADEGTHLHEVMAAMIDRDEELSLNDAINDPQIDEIWTRYGIKDERWFDCVVPAYRAYLALLDEAGDDDDLLIRTEASCQFPEVEGAFGTTDQLIKMPAKRKAIIWDWKFGAGVPVYASYTVNRKVQVNGAWGADDHPPEPEYEDETEEFGNDQLMFYAAAARNSYPHFFENVDEIELIICAPRMLGEAVIDRFTVTHSDLDDYVEDMKEAVEIALAGSTQYKVGKWCRFEACKTVCPLHLGSAAHGALVAEKLGRLKTLQDQSLTAADIAEVKHVIPAEIIPPSVGVPNYVHEDGTTTLSAGEMYAIGLHLKEILEPMLKGVAEDAQTFMEAGGKVPGYKLVPKKAGHDSWVDDDKAEKYLGRQGLPIEERRVVKPITPAVARTKLKALGKLDEKGAKQLAKYVDPGKSSGHTLAPESDSRPAIESTANAVASLADKLKSSLLLSDD
jgi:hypothetical protein